MDVKEVLFLQGPLDNKVLVLNKETTSFKVSDEDCIEEVIYKIEGNFATLEKESVWV